MVVDRTNPTGQAARARSITPPVVPPTSEAELLARARALAGHTLGTLAAREGLPVPDTLARAKGWVGQRLEAALGATARSRAEPDFPALGVELKTLPVALDGRPLETTFLTTLVPDRIVDETWSTSAVRSKIARVLWIPIEATPARPIAERRVGSALLWSPDADDERRLEADWAAVRSLVARGFLDGLTAELGEVLQVRPKAAHARVTRWGTGPDGEPERVQPRGFYLRTRFTHALLARHFVVSDRRGGMP